MPQICPTLYDVNAMMEIEASMAQGFAILLTGSGTAVQEQARGNKKGPSQQAVMLGFSALTDGNVIDACFGCTKNPSPQGQKKVKEVKRALSDASDSNSKIPRIAVGAYAKGFRILLSFRAEADKLNFLTRCFKFASIQKKAKLALEEAFAPLQEAIQAAS